MSTTPVQVRVVVGCKHPFQPPPLQSPLSQHSPSPQPAFSQVPLPHHPWPPSLSAHPHVELDKKAHAVFAVVSDEYHVFSTLISHARLLCFCQEPEMSSGDMQMRHLPVEMLPSLLHSMVSVGDMGIPAYSAPLSRRRPENVWYRRRPPVILRKS